jgi:hypothetical protein
VIDFLERETGLEPATSSLGSWHSTTELLPLAIVLNYLSEREGLNGQSYKSIQFTLSSFLPVWIAKRTAWHGENPHSQAGPVLSQSMTASL